jgi:ABC-type glycerol-3-phosphate transport system substrate-binding protein
MKRFIVLMLVVSLSLIALAKPRLEVWGRSTFVTEQNTWMTSKVNDWAKANNVDVNFILIPVEQFNQKISAAFTDGRLHSQPRKVFSCLSTT